MSNSSAASNAPALSLSPLRIIGVLPPVPGGEANLLPRDAWLLALRVEFDLWSDSTPADDAVDVLQLIWNGDEANPVDTKSFTGPITEADRENFWLEVPVSKLDEGVHSLYYKLLPWNGSTPRTSVPVDVTIDKTAPTLATPSTLIFPPEVRPPNELTAYYLELNNDQVSASLPVYMSPRPWDRITWYWGASPGNTDQGGVIELDDKNYSDQVVITVPGDLIRDRNDGYRYVWYQVHDRAGNPSLRSDPVELKVAATPIPRTLPWPSIERAAGTGEQQTLDPLQASSGAIVEVPEAAVIYPREPVRVIWGEPGELGHWIADQPITPGQLRFSIPMKSVAAYIGKTLWVNYGVTDGTGKEWPSIRRKVQVVNLSGLPTVQCNGLSGGSLSLKTVDAAGAILRMDKWPLMTTDQWLLITMTGVGSSGQDSVLNVISKRALTDQEVIGGIGGQNNVRVSKTFLNTLRRNAPLTGKVYVSFDGGRTWPPIPAPNFPLLNLTLID